MSYVGEIKDGVLKAYKGAPSASLKITTKATKIGTSAFKRKKSLTSVTIHDGVTEIGDSAFEECSKLKKVSFSEGLRSIGDYAFWLCGNLSDMKLPDSVEEIGDMAFYDTPWLNKQEGTVYAGTVLLRAADGKNFSFADNTSSVAGGAFRTCAELESLTLPDGIKFVGNRAFGKRIMERKMRAVGFVHQQQNAVLMTDSRNTADIRADSLIGRRGHNK